MDDLNRLVEIKDVYKSYDDLPVLQGVSLTISKGEILGIIGPSGSGKSTLIRCINGLEEISQEILIKGQPINNRRESLEIRKKIGMVFQSFNLFPIILCENIANPCRVVNGMSKKKAQEVGEALLEKVRMQNKAHQYPGSLSGGENSGWPLPGIGYGTGDNSV